MGRAGGIDSLSPYYNRILFGEGGCNRVPEQRRRWIYGSGVLTTTVG